MTHHLKAFTPCKLFQKIFRFLTQRNRFSARARNSLLHVYPKNWMNSLLSKMLKNSLAAINWNSFQDKKDDSNTSDKDTFETLQTQKSKWTPLEESSSSLCLVPPSPTLLRKNCDGKLQMISLTAVLLSRYVCSYNKNFVCLIIKFKLKSGLI